METARPRQGTRGRIAATFLKAPAAFGSLRARLPTMRARLALFAILCAGVAMMMLTALLVGYATERRTAIERQIQKEAATITQSIDLELAINIARLEGLAASAALRAGDMEAVYQQAKSLALPPASRIQLYERDATGRRRVFFNTALPYGAPPAPQLSADSDRMVEQFIADIATTRVAQVTDVIISNLTGLPISAVGVPVVIDDVVRYMFVAVLPAMDNAPIFGPGGLPEHWFSGVIDRMGRYVAGHRSPERAANLPVVDAAFREAAAEGESVFRAHTQDGRVFHVAVSRSTKTGWMAVVGAPRSVLDGPRSRALKIFIAAGGVMLLATLGLAIIAEPRIAWPLRRRLIEGEERFRATAHTVPGILFSTDADGRCDYASDAFYGHTGLPAGAAEGFGWIDVLHPEDRERALDLLVRPSGGVPASAGDAQAGRVVGAEIRLRDEDGAYRWFLMRARAALDADGKASKRFGTITDIDALKRTERQLRAVSAQLLRTQDDERRRIAREIHDTTLQDLVGVTLMLDWLRNRGVGSEDAVAALDDMRATLKRSSTELRTLTYLLHPPLLDEVGLSAAIQWYAAGFEKRSGIHVTTQMDETMPRLADDIATALFRVVQEGLTNVYRHSGSREAVLTLAATQDAVRLEIIDFGTGLKEPSADADMTGPASLGVGIPGMRLRLQQIGGSLEIDSGPAGTTLRACVPLPDGATATA